MTMALFFEGDRSETGCDRTLPWPLPLSARWVLIAEEDLAWRRRR